VLKHLLLINGDEVECHHHQQAEPKYAPQISVPQFLFILIRAHVYKVCDWYVIQRRIGR
jgi:hypothetical protein